MNNVSLVGRLAQEVDLRYVPGTGTAVANFTIAVNRDFVERDGSRKADFIDIQVWNGQAEACANYLKKGNMVSVQGSIRIESYTDNMNTRRRSFRINANRVDFLTPKNNMGNNNNSMSDNQNMFVPSFEPSQELSPEGFSAINDDDIPF